MLLDLPAYGPNVQFYTQYTLPKTLCAVQERGYANYIVYLLGGILDKVECCLYIVIFNEYSNRTCILSTFAAKVHVVYTYMNQGLSLREVWILLTNILVVLSKYDSTYKCYTGNTWKK